MTSGDTTLGRVRPGALSALLLDLVRPEAGAEAASWIGALRPGAVVASYELVRQLGRGGFGVVYEARDRRSGRAVAFKAVFGRGRTVMDDDRVLREAELAARLSHPNIVVLHDAGRCEHGPYLVLELLQGESLTERLRRGPLPIGEALRVTREVAEGVAHAHAAGVIHRDLTPGNVFLCRDGRLKVLDLGLAHAFGRRKIDGGTPAYMAPEQRRGAPEDERSDVFALGVLVHQMIAGELPFGDAPGAEIGPPPLLHVPAAPALAPLVQRMLQADPTARPRDAGKVLAELRAVAKRLRADTSGSQGASRPARRATGGSRRPPPGRTGR